ncbi:MAG: winged helix-turn-helix domain-containing protein, partial [Verrucomicrobiota bacterium]
MKKDVDEKINGHGTWTFLTNYSHVLICLYRDPTVRLRDVADQVGVTERAVQRIVREMEEAGVISRHRNGGRRNTYTVHARTLLRHPLEGHCSIGDLLAMV